MLSDLEYCHNNSYLVGYVYLNGDNSMYGTKDIIREAAMLPVEERVLVVDSLLRTLNPPDTEVDKVWAQVAVRRLEDLRSGRVQPVPGDQVFAKVRERFE